MPATERFHHTANDCLERLADALWPDAKLALVIYTSDKPELDIVLKDSGLNVDEVVSTLRHRGGLSLDGENIYKRLICDAVVGAMACGKQNSNPAPEGHWGQEFWDIGRAEGALQEELAGALRLARKELDACQRAIHYAGGFDPAYVNDAQAAIKTADAVLEKIPA
ncbi:hypothetical protein PPUJ20028_33540 [Pseudomonas putida]|uniref:Uncharacterized protein n=1 Tax=Pseudomonas putida TaxID=303 RepID=A0AA37VSH2_PSEPU|nr:hypothetical protein [Pseudomonas putida]GLO14771.1 hypothetical protein PPUJ20028_33540 [Pseudomonas putida]GLO34862.1 hypothetical protein PPUN14671_16950 [Pseudomonas putida]HDS0963653.1 hypothetical protein [Pseudomonas putida]HDS0988913.1 hypothetical protein [Pseudomonas putida]